MRFKNDRQRKAVMARLNSNSCCSGNRFSSSTVDPIERLVAKKRYRRGDFDFPIDIKKDFDGSFYVFVGEASIIRDMISNKNDIGYVELEGLKSRIEDAIVESINDREFSGKVPITEREIELLKSIDAFHLVEKDPFSSADPYGDLNTYLESEGISWEEYSDGKPVPSTVYDPYVPTPEEEYKEFKKLRKTGSTEGSDSKMSVKSLDDIKGDYDKIWDSNDSYESKLSQALKFLRRHERSKRKEVSSWAAGEINGIYESERIQREEARMEDPSRGRDPDWDAPDGYEFD
jgi:hypothetical protein